MPYTDSVESALYDSIRHGNLDATKRLLKDNPPLLRYDNYAAGSLLHVAARGSSPEMIDLLVKLGCDVNVEMSDSSKWTPLSVAVGYDSPPVVQRLLELGSDPNRSRCLIGAIVGFKTRSLEIVKLLDQYGADLHKVFINEHTHEPMNALSTAIDWGKEDVAEYLRSRGCVLPQPAAPSDEEPILAEAVPSLDDEVIAYFAEHFGPVQKPSLIQIVPTGISVAIHVIPASAERKHITLFTTGMSSHPMTVPSGMEQYARAELFIQLPADWKVDDLHDPNCSWPQHWLRSMAQYPRQHDTWLGGPVTIVANDEPPQPLAPNMQFTSLLLMAERDFTSRDGHTIRLYRMTPLYTEERNLEIREGIPALLRAFDRHSVPFIVNLQRPNVAG